MKTCALVAIIKMSLARRTCPTHMLMAVVIMIIIMIEIGGMEFSFGASAVQLTIILTCFVFGLFTCR